MACSLAGCTELPNESRAMLLPMLLYPCELPGRKVDDWPASGKRSIVGICSQVGMNVDVACHRIYSDLTTIEQGVDVTPEQNTAVLVMNSNVSEAV